MNGKLILLICLTFFATRLVADQNAKCTSNLVETIPEHLTYNETVFSKDTHDELMRLINSATRQIDIASFYWTLLPKDVMPEPVPESRKGQDILDALVKVAKTKSIKLRIAVNDDKQNNANNDDLMALQQVAQIKRYCF